MSFFGQNPWQLNWILNFKWIKLFVQLNQKLKRQHMKYWSELLLDTFGWNWRAKDVEKDGKKSPFVTTVSGYMSIFTAFSRISSKVLMFDMDFEIYFFYSFSLYFHMVMEFVVRSKFFLRFFSTEFLTFYACTEF